MASPRERAELVEIAKNVDEAHEQATGSDKPSPHELYEWRRVHMRFHMRIAECTKLPFLAEQIEKNQLLIFNWFYDHQLYGGRKLPARWHEQLARAVAEGSEQAADAAMRKHLHNRLDDLLVGLERFLLSDQTETSRDNGSAAAITIQETNA